MNNKPKNIIINLPEVNLPGLLNMVEDSQSLIIFTHGAGSSRLSPRNTFVADYLNTKGFSTLLFDLLTKEEDEIYENRFDIDLITNRLIETTKWLEDQDDTKDLSFGYFGASTGAAAALKASINFENVKAIVSRGGRPDLVIDDLALVEAPTLLIVGSFDDIVVGLNEDAFEALKTIKKFVVIPGASHLFEEPGKIEEVAEVAANWFLEYL